MVNKKQSFLLERLKLIDKQRSYQIKLHTSVKLIRL